MAKPTRIVYVNGQFVPEMEAKISIFDRGFLFADSVYEVNAVINGQLLEVQAHLQRLQRSLNELMIPMPMSASDLLALQREIVARNQLEQGMVYTQVTRGITPVRDFALPSGISPSLIVLTQAKELIHNPLAQRGLNVLLVSDIRWQRRDIKTTALLAQSLAKQQAINAGMDEAWLVEDGLITEGTSNNAFIITHDKQLITRQLSCDILHGITRASILKLAQMLDITVVERAFTPDEAYQAKEAFLTSAATFVLPVVTIDQHPIGNGQIGFFAQQLRQLYIESALKAASSSA